MSRTWAVLLVGTLVAFVGCGGSNAPTVTANAGTESAGTTVAEQPQEQIDVQLEGTWHGQMVVNASDAAQKLAPEQLDALKAMEMKMTFDDKGTLILAGEANGKPYESQNQWDLVGYEGNRLTIKSVDAEGKAKNVDLYFIDSNSFDMPLSTEVANLGAM